MRPTPCYLPEGGGRTPGCETTSTERSPRNIDRKLSAVVVAIPSDAAMAHHHRSDGAAGCAAQARRVHRDRRSRPRSLPGLLVRAPLHARIIPAPPSGHRPTVNSETLGDPQQCQCLRPSDDLRSQVRRSWRSGRRYRKARGATVAEMAPVMVRRIGVGPAAPARPATSGDGGRSTVDTGHAVQPLTLARRRGRACRPPGIRIPSSGRLRRDPARQALLARGKRHRRPAPSTTVPYRVVEPTQLRSLCKPWK